MSHGFTSEWLAMRKVRTEALAREMRPHSEVTIESDLHDAIIDECHRRRWIYLHGSMAARTHRTAGEPDFVILADSGRVFFIECKSRTGKLSPVQLALKRQAELLGHTVHIVRCFTDFINVVNTQIQDVQKGPTPNPASKD